MLKTKYYDVKNMISLTSADLEDTESLILGYSASTLGIGEQNGEPQSKLTDVNNQAKKKSSHFSASSVLSLTSISSPSKPPVVLDKWYLQAVRGSKAIKVCGTDVSDGKFVKSSAIQIRVSSICIIKQLSVQCVVHFVYEKPSRLQV